MANYSDIKASGAVVTSYANYAALPSSGNSAGDLALTTDNGGLYVWDGSEWDRVASGADETPEFTTEPAASYELNSDGTPTVITVAAIDPEGFPITYSHDTVPSNQAQATITNVGGTFTVTPSTTEANAGTFTLRLKANDGVNTTSKSTSLDLSFYSGLLQFSPSIDGSSEWDSVSGASSITLTDSSQEYTVTNPNSNAVVIQFFPSMPPSSNSAAGFSKNRSKRPMKFFGRARAVLGNSVRVSSAVATHRNEEASFIGWKSG